MRNILSRHEHLSCVVTDYTDKRFGTCPVCGTECKRHSIGKRKLIDIGLGGVGIIRVVQYNKLRCNKCNKILVEQHGIPASCRFSPKVVNTAIAYVDDGMTLEAACYAMWCFHSIKVTATTLHDWIQGERNDGE